MGIRVFFKSQIFKDQFKNNINSIAFQRVCAIHVRLYMFVIQMFIFLKEKKNTGKTFFFFAFITFALTVCFLVD